LCHGAAWAALPDLVIPPSMTQIFVVDSQLTSIPSNALSNSTSNITILSFAYNLITTIADDAFRFFPLLDVLVLDNNLLTIIAPAVFAFIPRLRTLSLWSNEITKVFFRHARLPLIEQLALNANPLQSIANEDFIGVSTVQGLFLKRALLSIPRIDRSFLANFPRLSTLEISENKFGTLPDDIFGDCSASLTVLQIEVLSFSCEQRKMLLGRHSKKISPTRVLCPGKPTDQNPDVHVSAVTAKSSQSVSFW
jgi:Leucine-rich repeat (LRR) protein